MSWLARANCRGVETAIFFRTDLESKKQAKTICGGCSVRTECAEYAFTRPEYAGIWGGMTERKRKDVRQDRNRMSRMGRLTY